MADPQHLPTPDAGPRPAVGLETPTIAEAGSPAASAPTRGGFTLRGRRWAYGATLAAAGVLAGSGVTYAVVSTTASTPTAQSAPQQVGPGGSGAGPQGGPPSGGALDGTAPDGTAPSTGPDTELSGGTQDGEPT